MSDHDTRAGRAKWTDAIALDHFPSCPHCGNLCGKLARMCADCGCLLFEPMNGERNTKREMAARIAGRFASVDAPPRREDTQAIKETEGF